MLNKLEKITQSRMGYCDPVTAFLAAAPAAGSTATLGTIGAAAAGPAAAAAGATAVSGVAAATAVGAGLTLSQVANTASAISSVGGIVQGRAASKASKAQLRHQQRLADLRNARERRQAVRQARIARAQIIAGGESAGIGLGSSAVQGGTAGVTSQLNANTSFLDQAGSIQGSIFSAGQASAQAQSNQATFGAIQDIASPFSTIFNRK